MRTLLSKSIITLVASVALSTVLGGCESMKPKQYETSSTPAPVAAAPDDSRLMGAPGIQPVQQFPMPSNEDLRVMTSKLSGGAVELYDLDTPSSGYSSISSVQTPAGVPLASDPRVTVYPLDGGEFNAGVYNASSYAAEPVSSWPQDNTYDGAGSNLPRGSHVFFEHGSANVQGSGRRVVADAAETSKFAPLDRISIEGHASARVQTGDPIRGRILNLKESMNRAFEVSKDLIEAGVPAEKIKTVGWGDTKPVDGNEAAQRRVDIVTGQ